MTGVDKVTYVGHSQGTSQMFYALASNEYKIMDMVNFYVALAPVARMNGAFESLKLICENMDIVDDVID